MRSTRIAWVPVMAASVALALWWPGREGTPSAAHLRAIATLGLIASLVFGSVVTAIAWRSREWSPALLALGCLSMALGAAMRFVFAATGLGLAPGAGANALPLVGLLLGAPWFAFSVVTHAPTTGGGGARVRVTMVAGAMLALGVCGGVTAWSPVVPGDAPTRLLAGAAAPGYLFAAVRFASVYRFLRLPSQLATAAGAALFAPALIALATGGVPTMLPWETELAMLALAALPVTGFIIEQRARPGLRTMVLGLFLPGAVAAMRRGYPRQLNVLAERIGAYDAALRGHTDRVADLATRLAVALGLAPGDLRGVMVAAQLHDVGKLLVPAAILDKPGALDEREWQAVRRHPEEGAAIVGRTFGRVAAAGVGEHHERWDGSGYPGGKRGEATSLVGRVVAVADVFDALTNERSYKPAWGTTQALAEIERGAGSAFDPRVVAALEDVLETSVTSTSRAA
jgi:HD-GYP domain-containing protein (c-di-GMP phosphodiesterase class II)